MKKYLFHYYFQGAKWACDVYANNPEKIKAISQAIYDSELKCEIRIPENPLSRVARLIARITKNIR